MHRFCCSCLFVVCLASASWGQVQLDHAKTTASGPTAAVDMDIHLGDSVVALYGPWKFQIGDSPVDPATHAPLWAEPGFDDSRWETVDLTPQHGSLNPINGLSDYVRGWTGRGHPGYWGYGWYRINVRVQAISDASLALEGPPEVDDAYQAFDNGTLVGTFGDFASGTPAVYYSRPMMFPLSQPVATNIGASTQVIAFRIWMQPQTLSESSVVGGFESAPSLGESDSVAARYQVRWDELIRAYLWEPIEGSIFFLLGVVALSLAFFDRSDRVYLWIAALLLMVSADNASGTMAVWTQWVNSTYDNVSHNVILFSLYYAGWVMVWRVWFRQRRPVWVPWALLPLVVLLMVSSSLSVNLFFTVVSGSVMAAAHVISLVARLMLAVFMFGIVFKGIQEQGIEGWLVLPAVLLAGVSEFRRELATLHIPVVWFPFGVQVTLSTAADLLLVTVLSVLLIRRLRISMRRQRLMALDVKQAQEVQHVILPEARTILPGLVVESEYRPALEVGGDFFQIIPHPADGSLLIVAGDVTGKGLKAGMLVALLVGAIRSTAEATTEPLIMLQALNRRLMGRGDAQATCLALHIAADGSAVLANAGHMPPYLNGEPLQMEGALPLGLIEASDFSVMRFKLAESDRLVLLSDGVAEATDADGHLFGFERIQELLAVAGSANEVATIAQDFGQEDDISVITVTRVAAQAPAFV